jgi:hypothetical protein
MRAMSYEVVLLLERADATAKTVGAPVALPSKTTLASALDQCRDWPAAAAAVARARAAVKLVDELPSEERLEPFVARVAAAVAKLPCVAVWWLPAERLVEPAAVAAAARAHDPLRVALNVRLFHVEKARPDERVIDTVGLAAFGLPDVQCHFFGLDAAAVGALVEDTARYVFAEGDVIGDGDTVPGPEAGGGAPWACRREVALVDPPRDVLDLGPPPPYGARRA